jgi:PIN domain nuclease of toxin-antitoxin system
LWNIIILLCGFTSDCRKYHSRARKTTLELGLTYGNNKISDTSVGGYIPVQIADTSFVNVPTFINDEKIQMNFLLQVLGRNMGL